MLVLSWECAECWRWIGGEWRILKTNWVSPFWAGFRKDEQKEKDHNEEKSSASPLCFTNVIKANNPWRTSKIPEISHFSVCTWFNPLFIPHLLQPSAPSTYSALFLYEVSRSLSLLFCFQSLHSKSCQKQFNYSHMSSAGSRCPLLTVGCSTISHGVQAETDQHPSVLLLLDLSKTYMLLINSPCTTLEAALINISLLTVDYMIRHNVNEFTCGDKPTNKYHSAVFFNSAECFWVFQLIVLGFIAHNFTGLIPSHGTHQPQAGHDLPNTPNSSRTKLATLWWA